MGKAARNKRQRRASSEQVPEWATGHTAGGFARMLDLLISGYAELGYDTARTDLDEAALFISRSSEPSIELRVSLVNIAIALQRISLDEWPVRVRAFVGSALEGFEPDGIADWDEVAPRLRVRLYSGNAGGGLRIPGRVLTPGLVLAPVVDYPTAARVVSEPEIAAWGKSSEELVELGLELVFKHEPLPEPTIVPLRPFGAVRHYAGTSIYLASHIARLPELLPAKAAGALVAVPRRDVMMLHPVVDVSAVLAVDAMARVAAQICEAGPYGLSHLLYWWHEGVLDPVTQLDRRGLRVRVPRELVTTFEALMPRPSAATASGAERSH